ncbi:MAG: hypothetical protein ACRC67_17515, partial [Inquilinus sp.]|uniref:hypothetical protein n=1 Tax=Inquilinus sp. TaxID=1932117 RepID=UPI003F34044E
DLADRQEHSLPNARSFSTTNRSQPKKPKRLCGSQAASILKVRNLGQANRKKHAAVTTTV